MNPFKTLLPALALASFVAGCASLQKQSVEPTAAVQTAQKFEFVKTQSAHVDYLLYLPRDYKATGETDKRWPLVMFLHGAGERGTNIWKAATHGPPMQVTNHTDFPFILVSPQCPEGAKWSNDILLALLDRIMSKYAVDPDRVYLTGLSMGGFGTWDLGLGHPEKFAAIVPICGGGDILTPLLASREKAAALRTLGIWAFHGAKDPVVPLGESQRMVEAARRAGVKEVKLTVYPEAGHNSWTEAYNDPELYKWLLEHSRGKTK